MGLEIFSSGSTTLMAGVFNLRSEAPEFLVLVELERKGVMKVSWESQGREGKGIGPLDDTGVSDRVAASPT